MTAALQHENGLSCDEKMAEEVIVIAKYDYKAENSQELDIKKNEKLRLLDDSKEWWKVQNMQSKSGFVPSNYVKKSKPSFFSSLLTRKKNKCPVASHPVSRNGVAALDQKSPGGADIQICEPVPAIVKYGYQAQRPDEISLTKSERVIVMQKSIDGWWRGRKDNEEYGWFPSNYVELEQSSSDLSGAARVDFGAMEGIEVVTALYTFKRSNQEELSFEKGDRLLIVEKPVEDPDWWKARNKFDHLGLVPRNYVQSVDDIEYDTATNDSSCTPHSQSASSLSNASSLSVVGMPNHKPQHISGPLADKEWYFGKITRSQCEEMLTKHAEDGDFLIRDSESTVGHYTVVLKAPGRNKHFRVQVNDGVYQIGQQTFSSLDDMIEHYKKHPIYKQDSEKLYLVKAFIYPLDF
ncbi:cytoplasmic protein NCK1-like [Argonauta hians]